MKQNVDDIRRIKTDKLSDQGFEFLADGEFSKALEIAAKLEALCYTGAFELGALAHYELGELDEAISYLKKGVSLAPKCWLIWQLLGNYLSDAELYEEAFTAYDESLLCPDVWRSSVCLNQAILSNRCGHYAEALEFLSGCIDPELLLHRSEVEVFALVALERFAEADELARSVLNSWVSPDGHKPDADQCELLGRIAASLGRVCLAQNEEVGEIRELALQYLYLDPTSQSLLALLREIDSQVSRQSHCYAITVSCKLPEINNKYHGVVGYIVNYQVVADNEGEALRYIRRIEEPGLQANILAEHVDILQAEPDELKGVYCRSSRIYYERED
ncbi:MAG: hypothetical protein OEZ68_07880 [Gammaproteobacteria bacterium]|nr:hypothetical protein [Gammaproteobacteria bacterium]MDH5800705.1 hypothetical protein [Gammaproteobacteria bacterium]